MDRVMANRINGKKGGEQNIKNQVDTNNSLEAPLEALVEAPLQGKLIEVKESIRKTYSEEVYLTLIDEEKDFVKFNISQGSKEYIIPIFTDISEYKEGKEKIFIILFYKKKEIICF